MDAYRADKLSKLLSHLRHGVLATFDLLTFATSGDPRRKPAICAKNDLEVLT